MRILIAFLMPFFIQGAFAQNDLILAPSENIRDFDRVLAKQPLPRGSERVLKQLEKREKKKSEVQKGPLRAMRQSFEKSPNSRPQRPPQQIRQRSQQRDAVGPARERGERVQREIREGKRPRRRPRSIQ